MIVLEKTGKPFYQKETIVKELILSFYLCDSVRMCIDGGSAGGYTVLATLAFRPGIYAAGTSSYGICDLVSLAALTHKVGEPHKKRTENEIKQSRLKCFYATIP